MLHHSFIAIFATSILITLLINIAISKVARLNFGSNKTDGNFNTNNNPATLATRFLSIFILLFVSLYLSVYNGFTLVQLFRGMFGDLSITTLFILFFWLRNFTFIGKCRAIDHKFALIVTLSGSILYLSTFGFISFDLYDLGYFPNGLFLITFIAFELYLWRYNRRYAYFWLISLVAFYFKLENSNNFWDYLFDPVLWVICLIRVFLPKVKTKLN